MIKSIEEIYQDGQPQPTELPQRVINAWSWGAQDQLIANATVMGDRLLVFSCAMEKLEIAFSDLPCLKLIPIDERGDFTISEEGSYLHWPKQDIHLDLDALRCAINPNVKNKFDAYKLTHDRSFGQAIATLRKQSKLKQSDIIGLSERQVSRIEKGEGTKIETLDLFAQAHQMELNDYLEAVANLMMDVSETIFANVNDADTEESLENQDPRQIMGFERVEVVAKKMNSDCHP